MSKLLEKAIIDAEALKEAALKSAEKLVIEKYSNEVKQAVDALLSEQPEAEAMSPGDLGMQDVNTMADPFGDDVGLDAGMGEESEGDEASAGEKLDPDSLMGSLPSSFDTDDEELITIKLDSLEAEYEDEEEEAFAGGDEMGDDEIGIDIFDDDEEDFSADADDEEEINLDSDLDMDADIDADSIGVDITSDIMQEVLDELGLDASEIDFDDLLERVRVDFEPQKSGWAGTPESIMQEYEAMLLAREQDSEVKEKNTELRKNIAALKQENKTLSSVARKLQAQNDKYETAFNTLQEKLETMNVSNAKLLYINQALENASLNERQRRKIVEAISKAETVQEAKIIFETMNDTVTTASDVRKDATLNEMVSRRSSLLVAARNEQPNKDANPLYTRMQKLAGIKTK